MVLYQPKKLRIGLQAYNSAVLDETCNKIVDSIKNISTETNTRVIGPIPLPTKRRIYCVLRSPHVNKDSREHFEIRTHKRLIDVCSPCEQTLKQLKTLDLSAGIDVEIRGY